MLINGDCLEKMKDIPDKSVDVIFCDLPYGQTSCSWDCKIDLQEFWKQVMRIKKLNTPIIMTTTTKFGVSLINSAPKKCPFRYDLIWCKSASCGFLSAKKMPLRKHEMIYVFYEKLPFYDLSSHKHKFIKERNTKQKNGKIYEGEENNKKIMEGKYEPPLPNTLISITKDESVETKEGAYGGVNIKPPVTAGSRYEPPLPDSLIKETDINAGGNNVDIIPNEDYDKREKKTRNTIKKEENYGKGYLDKKVNFRKYNPKLGAKGEDGHLYDPPLPDSLIKETDINAGGNNVDKNIGTIIKDTKLGTNTYNTEKRKKPIKRLCNDVSYEPPLPNSLIKETDMKEAYGVGGTQKYFNNYNEENGMDKHQGGKRYDPPLPNSLIKETDINASGNNNSNRGKPHYSDLNHTIYQDPVLVMGAEWKNKQGGIKRYDPPLPNSLIKETDDTIYGGGCNGETNADTEYRKMGRKNGEPAYDPPLPDSLLEIKSTRGKHSTEKPVDLMKWILKYYSKEGSCILDPTMGSGSMGVACKDMNRNFIGIEMDKDIYDVAVNRINNNI